MGRNKDNSSYWKYTGPMRVDKSMHTLEGLVNGISMDRRVTDDELRVLHKWISEHSEFANRHPFNEVIGRLNEVLSNGLIDEEERADILWLSRRFSTENSFFCEITSDMQRLQGMLAGIVADGKISKSELEGLEKWLTEHSHLKTCWPYDELEALIVAVLQDGVISREEHDALVEFFAQFLDSGKRKAISAKENEGVKTVQGVCAICPEIKFDATTFCFTGSSDRGTKREIEERIFDLGANYSKRLTMSVDYLVVGGKGNPCWAYACYGRKVEEAIEKRKNGSNVMIVHEFDFWDAIEDLA